MIQTPDSIRHKQAQEVVLQTPVDNDEQTAGQLADGVDEELEGQEGELKASATQKAIAQQRAVQEVVSLDSALWKQQRQGEPIELSSDAMSLVYKNSFFAKDSLLNTEVYGRQGIAGDPVPYSLHQDSVMSSVIIIATLFMLFCMRRASKFFAFQFRNFFRVVRNDSSMVKEAASDTRNLLVLSFYGAIVLALVFFSYSNEYISETYITKSEYALMGIFLADIVGCGIAELLLHTTVSNVFFDKERRSQWTTTKLFAWSLQGICLMPVLMLVAYFGLDTDNAIIYTLIVIVLVKIILFYKAFQIFFGKIGDFLQFFLYLCTLEIIPALILWGVLLITANNLKVNY